MRRAVAALPLVALLAGCSHVHPSNPTSGEGALDDVNRGVAGNTADVTLLNGAVFWAKDIEVAADSTELAVVGRPSYIQAWQVDVGSRVPNSDVRSISVRRRRRGMLERAVVGFVAGAATGMLLAASDPWFDTGDAWLAFGRIGMGVGFAWGGLVGSKDVYDFTRTRDGR